MYEAQLTLTISIDLEGNFRFQSKGVVPLAKFHKQKFSIVSSVAMHETQLTIIIVTDL